jgi:hypothetical protein
VVIHETIGMNTEGGKESRLSGCQGYDILSQTTVVASVVNDFIIENNDLLTLAVYFLDEVRIR